MLERLVLVLMLLPASVSTAEDLTGPTGFERWRLIETEHYLVHAEIDGARTTRIINDLDIIRAVLAESIRLEANSARPLHIIVFETDASFSRYAPRDQTGGFFLRGPDSAFIVLSAEPRRDLSRLIVHEYVHAVVADSFPEAPLWFNEGLAEFFGSISVDDAGITVGVPPADRLQQLRQSTLIPTEILLSADGGSPLYTDPDQRDLFYAQSWAMVHTLLLGADTDEAAWDHLVQEIQRDAFDERALGSAVGHLLSLDEIPTMTVSIPREAAPKTSTRETPPSETLTLLGDLMTARTPPDLDSARRHYGLALDLDPRCSRARAGMGALAEIEGRLDEAEASFERAVLLGPEDGWIRYRLGAFLFYRTTSWERAIKTLEDAIDLDPRFGPAWAVLAVAYAERRPEGAPILETAEIAHRLFPNDREVSRALLTLRLHADLRGEALELIEAATIPDSSERRDAFNALITNDLLRARESLLAGELEAATTRLALAENEIDAASAPGRLILEIREIERLIIRADLNRRIERAGDLARDGRPEAAIDLIDEVLGSDPDDETANTAASLKWQIQHPGSPLPARFLGPVITLTSEDEMEAINRHIATGEYRSALALLEDLDARTSAADRSWIDVKIEEIEHAIAHNRFAEDYNRAVDAFNRGDLRSAATILTRLVAELPPGPEAKQAAELLGRVSVRVDDSD